MSSPESTALLHALATSERGSRRDGAFATWLLVRVATDLADETEWPERAHRRRIQSLERRLTSLSLSPPLRRALAAALVQLRDGGPASVAGSLGPLVGPVRESVGIEAADAVRRVVAGQAGDVALWGQLRSSHADDPVPLLVDLDELSDDVVRGEEGCGCCLTEHRDGCRRSILIVVEEASPCERHG